MVVVVVVVIFRFIDFDDTKLVRLLPCPTSRTAEVGQEMKRLLLDILLLSLALVCYGSYGASPVNDNSNDVDYNDKNNINNKNNNNNSDSSNSRLLGQFMTLSFHVRCCGLTCGTQSLTGLMQWSLPVLRSLLWFD